MVFDEQDDGVRMANDSEYGLISHVAAVAAEGGCAGIHEFLHTQYLAVDL